MKKILYNNYVKFAAFVLCALAVAVSSYLVTTTFLREDNWYLFESDYEDSRAAGYTVNEEFYSLSRMLENTADENGVLHPEKMTNMPSPDLWECYIKTPGGTYTNLSNQSEENYDVFSNSRLAKGIRLAKDASGKYSSRESFSTCNNHNGYYFIYDKNDEPYEYEMCVRMGEKLREENRIKWEAVKYNADGAVKATLVLLACAAALFIYLLCVTGRKEQDGEIKLMLVDKMPVEITAALFLAILFGGGALVILGAVTFIIEEGILIANQLAAMAIFGVVSLSMLLTLSLVRNLKNGSFIKRSLTVKICGFLWGIAKKVMSFLWRTAKRVIKFLWLALLKMCRRIKNVVKEAKSTVLTVSAKNFDGRFVGIMIVAFAVMVCLLTLISLSAPVFILILIFAVGEAVIFVLKRLVGFSKIKEGIEKIKGGDLNHKIENYPDGIIGEMSKNINSIGDGLQKSLENEVKAERMKSELITNVSHDLKTPLTSIINYADLLSKEELTPPEANDYVKIIKQKGERLKQLTNDLFDISKAQSGNEEFIIEDIDLCILINQAMAELEESIKKSGLDFRVSSQNKEVFVKADGKKLSRVFENLFVNCVKYAMTGTRVYIDIINDDAEVRVEIKNIAGYEMDFDEAEILERFVRGDSSRTGEGSGLGLAIAKSYVEGCNGDMSVKKDGDLFKVIIHFTK